MALSDEEVALLDRYPIGAILGRVGLGTAIRAAEQGGLGALSVGTAELANLAVTPGKIAADAVDGTKLADLAVSTEHLDAGLAATHKVVAAGSYTSIADGGGANSITAAAVLGTDLAFATVHTKGAVARTILQTQAGAGVIDLLWSGDPSTDHVVKYFALRAIT